MNSHLKTYAPYRPRKGNALTYRGKPHGIVVRIEGGLCYYKRSDDSATEPFIWCFRDGLNGLFAWPRKDESKNTPIFLDKRRSSFMELQA